MQSDSRFEQRMQRRQRLVQRLGLANLAYADRRAALQSYRAERRAQRESTLAIHPDGE